MATLKGRRLQVIDGKFYVSPGSTEQLASTEPGDYWKGEDGWAGKVPTGARCGLRNHTVTEFDDGTISVQPSILLTCPGMEELNWHGYLERGIWREC